MQINNIKFELLLKTLEINSRKLSNAIHVDYSMISKWRLGNRKLTIESPHFNNIIDYILKLNKSFLISKLTKLLILSDNKSVYSDLDLKQAITIWIENIENTSSIINYDNNTNSYSALYRVYIGNRGKRAAIKHLLDMALTLPDGQTLNIYSHEDKSWFTEDKNFFSEYLAKMTKLVEKKCTINLIRVLEYHSVKELYMFENDLFFKHPNSIHNWYMPIYSGLVPKISLHALEGHAVISSASPKSSESSYAFFDDPFTVQLFSNVFSDLLSKARALLFPYTLSTLEQFHKKVWQTLQQSHNSIRIYKRGLTMLLLPRELLVEILHNNGISDELIKKICSIYDNLSRFNDDNTTKIVFNHELLESTFDFNSVFIFDLSILLGKTIYINLYQFKMYMKNVIDNLHTITGFEVGFLTPYDSIYYQPLNVTILENSALIITDISKVPLEGVITPESIFVHDYYIIYHEIWNEISPRLRKKEFVINLIENLLDSI